MSGATAVHGNSNAARSGLERGLPRLEMRAPALIARQKRRIAQANASAENVALRITETARVEAERMLADAKVEAARIIAIAMEQAAAIMENATDSLPEDVAARLSAKDIIDITAHRHGLTTGDILGHRRCKAVVRVRHAAMAAVYLARPDMSLPQIGRAFKRDHTSILHALRKTGTYKGGKKP